MCSASDSYIATLFRSFGVGFSGCAVADKLEGKLLSLRHDVVHHMAILDDYEDGGFGSDLLSSKGISAFDLGNDFRCRRTKNGTNPKQHVDGRRLVAVFQLRDIGPVNFGLPSQL